MLADPGMCLPLHVVDTASVLHAWTAECGVCVHKLVRWTRGQVQVDEGSGLHAQCHVHYNSVIDYRNSRHASRVPSRLG